MAINMYDQLVEACREAENWPLNLLRKQQLNRVLCNYQQRLHADESRLLDTKRASVDFWEAPIGSANFQETTIKSIEELIQHFHKHLHNRVKDPKSRHVFISAPHSWAALRCTPQMLHCLCSYEQVSPILIDVLASFGKQRAPLGFQSASFCQDDLTKPSQSALVAIPEVGRSGWELRHCYKLHGLETSSPNTKAKWSMRQTAVYHSFDLENGRAFWLTVKANNEIRDRIMEGTESLEAMRASNSSGLGPSFVACLNTHLIAFDWCTEGWRLHLGDIENDVREILVKVKGTPIEPLGDELNFTPRLIGAATMPSLRDREGSMISRQNTLPSVTGPIQALNAVKAGLTNVRGTLNAMVSEAEVEKSQETSTPRDVQADQQEKISNHLEKLKTFSFAEFQKLNFYTTKLQEAKLAMHLNLGGLRGTREYYKQRYQSTQFPSAIKDFSEINGSYENFTQRVTSLAQDLEADIARAEALILSIEDGKRLYDSILQSYNMEINRLFTLSGHGISERMEESAMRMEKVTDSMLKIAHATARDSASMSAITFVTLVLLPGTFLGTFFSTPIVNAPEDNPQTWNINWSVFMLFLKICIPMTVLVMFIWALYMAFQGYHGESSYDRFRVHIEENLEDGYEAQGSPAKFASKYCLTKYWTVDLVEEIVFATEDFDYQILEIREQYLRIFSTLVWISTTGRSYVRYLKHFVRNGTDDSSLPFRGRPDIFPNANDSEIFWTAFFENQWKFFPVELGPRRMYDRTLHASQILPLTIGEELGAQNIGRPASIHLAHASEMLARTYSTDCNLVLKSYGSLYKSNYYNEIKAYNAFNNATPCENIVKCLGSYHVQPLAPGSGLKFTILLEYANRGSLLEVYQKNDPPVTFAETKAFWSNLLQVAKGLMVAQNTPPKRPGASCVHQDLKPSNILVFGRENVSSSENDLTFKISDFGNSHTRRSAPDDPGRLGYDNGSTRTYCPPELHWNHEVDFTVGPLVDMWSLGCVLIEAAVWICFGQRGRIEFQ
ncbi:hypothetical protein N8I77_006319 [Diaporthe amygdali]|uniref:Protein kinase domain-containing protein n=1 Tax=Phomopsis amygdali TaxID=1214568 RepID=A0AAD9W3V3_PHOAM|nr:hypothetical protein N8I77_006319 [Diaporthe amygdali]